MVTLQVPMGQFISVLSEYFFVLNISHVSNLGQSAYLETETRIFTFST